MAFQYSPSSEAAWFKRPCLSSAACNSRKKDCSSVGPPALVLCSLMNIADRCRCGSSRLHARVPPSSSSRNFSSAVCFYSSFCLTNVGELRFTLSSSSDSARLVLGVVAEPVKSTGRGGNRPRADLLCGGLIMLRPA